MMNDYKVVIIDSFSQWNELSRQWNELLTKSSANTIFLTWEWTFSWAESYLDPKRTLFILVVYKGDEIVGIAPWYIQHLRLGALAVKKIQFLGTPEAGSDYLDVIIKKGQEKKVTLCLYDFLLKEVPSRWDCCMLQDLVANSLFLVHFLDKIEDEGKYAEIRPSSFCPAVVLPKKSEDFFSTLSPNRRQQFRRHLRLLQNGRELNHSSLNGENIDKALRDFLALYEEKNEHHDKTIHSFLWNYSTRCGKAKPLQVDLLTSNGKQIAGLLHLKYQDTLYMYLMAVDKDYFPQVSIGNVLVGFCMDKAIESGFSEYDFLKGTEPYKFHWAEGGRSSLNLFYYQKKIGPLILAMVKFLKYTAKIMMR